MAAPTKDQQTMEFVDGRSANVDVYQSEKGTLVVVTHDATNPFNHGEELLEKRSEIADKICKDLNCEPRDFKYIEQAGQHFQSVPLDRAANGDIKLQDHTRITLVPEPQLQEAIRENQSQQVGHDVAQTQEWANHLAHPKDNAPDR